MIANIGQVRQRIKAKADSTLQNMRKADLIEYIRCLEHNYNVAVSFNENQARYIESLGVTVQQWIPVTERLPVSCDLVVALTTGGDRIIAKLDRYGWLRYGGYECERLRPITHWMPLPEPPKEV